MEGSVNRRRLVASAAVACAVLLGAGCASGGQAMLYVKPNLTSGQVGPIQAEGIVVVVDQHGAAAQLTGTLFNGSRTSSDQLTAVTVGGKAVAMTAPVVLASGQALNLASPAGPKFTVSPATDIQPGHTTEVDLTFAVAGRLTMDTVVQSNTGPYSVFQPAGG